VNLAQEAIAAKKRFEEIIAQIGREVFVELTKPVFEKHPEIEAIRWKQYVPAFNDGDPCVFRVCDSEVLLKDEDEFYGDYSDCGDSVPEQYEEALGAFDEALEQLEDASERCFDSNSEITIYRDGRVEVDEYDCGY
jgi:hypothetical protein